MASTSETASYPQALRCGPGICSCQGYLYQEAVPHAMVSLRPGPPCCFPQTQCCSPVSTGASSGTVARPAWESTSHPSAEKEARGSLEEGTQGHGPAVHAWQSQPHPSLLLLLLQTSL